jgi:hypothetical protein
VKYFNDKIYFPTKAKVVLKGTDTSEIIDTSVEQVEETTVQFQLRGCGWVFNLIEKFDICNFKYKPLRGKSHTSLRKELATKKAYS